MAEDHKQRVGELVRGVFEILKEHPEGLQAKIVFLKLRERVPPTPYEETTYVNKPNVRRYEKIVRFGTINAVKAGWLVKNKGSWSLTDEGLAALKRFADPVEFYMESKRLYKQWEAHQPADDNESEEDSGSAAATLEEAEEGAWAEIESFLEQMNPYDFQDMVAGLLRGMGYHIDWVSPPGPDGGIDIVAHVDPLGVKGPRIKVQVKRRGDRIAADGIRGFVALLGDSDVGLFVSTGGFSRQAEDEARRQERRRIMLLDLKRMFDLWTEHYDKIPEKQRRLLPLRPVYYLAPDE